MDGQLLQHVWLGARLHQRVALDLALRRARCVRWKLSDSREHQSEVLLLRLKRIIPHRGAPGREGVRAGCATLSGLRNRWAGWTSRSPVKALASQLL